MQLQQNENCTTQRGQTEIHLTKYDIKTYNALTDFTGLRSFIYFALFVFVK